VESPNPSDSSNTRLRYSPLHPTHEDRIISSYAEKAKVAMDSDLISSGKYEQLMLEAGLADLLFEPDVAEGDGSADP